MIYEIITEFYTEFQLTLSHTHTHTKPNWEIQVFLIMDIESAVLCFFFFVFLVFGDLLQTTMQSL